MDDPADPLATARTGGLESVVDIEQPQSRGCLGEVFICQNVHTRGTTAEEVRGVKIVQLVAANQAKYAVSEDGRVIDIGNGKHTPIDIPVHMLALGNDFAACIGQHDKRLYSWGNGPWGQLGLAHARGSKVLEALRTVKEHVFQQVACGDKHGAAVTIGGTVFTWGRGFEGQLGQGIRKEVDLNKHPYLGVRMIPRMVTGLGKSKVSQIACGDNFTIALDTQGWIWSWGEGIMGQLGTGRCTKRTVPTRVIGPEKKQEQENTSPKADDYADLIPRENQQEEQKLDQGQVPLLHIVQDEHKPEDEGVPLYFKQVVCGNAHVIAVDQTDQIFVWGFNRFGQLGLGDAKSRFVPENLATNGIELGQIKQICANKYSTLIVTNTGQVYTCGKRCDGVSVLTPTVTNVSEEDSFVELAQITETGSVMALVPSCASKVYPSNGPIDGGDTLRIFGVGFWDSDSIKVRFVPLKRKEDSPDTNQSARSNAADDTSDGGVVEIDLDQQSSDGEDDLSDTSSTSSISKDENDDPRTIEEVEGRFDPLTGCISCTTPPCAIPSVSLVQVALDGKTFTTDEIFYMYTKSCSMVSMTPTTICGTKDRPDETVLFSVSCNDVWATEELCIRFSYGDKNHILPGTFYQPPTPEPVVEPTPSPEEDEEEQAKLKSKKKKKHKKGHKEEEEEEEPKPVPEPVAPPPPQVQASVNLNQLIDALAANGESVIHAQVSVSLNGASFAAIEDVDAFTCTFSRISITHCTPMSAPCFVQGVPIPPETQVTLEMEGLLPDGPPVQVRCTIDGEKEGILLEAESNPLYGAVTFNAPSLDITKLHERGWGYRYSVFDVSVDSGSTWFRSPQSFAFYNGALQTPSPGYVPVCGTEIELRVDPANPEWLFPESTPSISLWVTSEHLHDVDTMRLVLDDVTRSEDGNALYCKVPNLSEIYNEATETVCSILYEKAKEKSRANHEIPQEASDEEVEAIKQVIENEARLATTGLFKEQLLIDGKIAINGTSFVQDLGNMILFEQPNVGCIEPSSVDRTKFPTAQSEETEEVKEPKPVTPPGKAKKDAKKDTKKDPKKKSKKSTTLSEFTIQLYSPAGIPDTPNALVRFTSEDNSHTIDVPGNFEPFEEEEHVGGLGGFDEEGNMTHPTQQRELKARIPAFPVPGNYMVQVALNGQDFSLTSATLQVTEPAPPPEEEPSST